MAPRSAAKGPARRATGQRNGHPQRLEEIEDPAGERIPLPVEEFARVLGGGVVPGSVILIGGEPGIGKSTLMLQIAMLAGAERPVLYVSGEESEQQIKARADRIGGSGPFPSQLYLYTETRLEAIVGQVESLKPAMLVVDSIQTMLVPELEASAGSVSQVREAASRLQALAKGSGTAVFLVGHVTKDGAIAGPKILEHIVDTVLYLEGDPFHAYRLLRSVKNRFGPTSEVGVFEMEAQGLREVSNPSQAFLAERVAEAPGSAIAVTMEGTRPLLVEIQGLTSTTSFGNPRRTANGVDFNRLLLVVAVLSRRVGLRLADQDVFVNVVGGLRVQEPAADLAMAVAIASSLKDRPLRPGVALVGEVGLSGELRTVSQLPSRLREAGKLGFGEVIVPSGARKLESPPDGLRVRAVRTLREALQAALAKGKSGAG
jgi:DNA repair protein RadA/Sms